jgi:hypothetical protein
MKKLIEVLFIFCCTSTVVWAQRKSAPKETIIQAPSSSNRSKVISKNNDGPSKNLNPTGTLALGISTSTSSGIFGGLTAKKVWMNNNKIQSLIGVDLSIIKDYREFDSPYSYNGRGYTEGKLNQLIVIRPEYGRQWTLFKKPSEGGAALKGLIATGPNIGMQMPYHVDISYVNPGSGKSSILSIPMSQTYDNTYQRTTILGESSFFKGASESIYVPGWHLKGAFNVELDSFKQNYLALEMGFIVDYFSKPIEMLNQTPQRSVYTTGYLTFFFGKSK